MVAGGDVGERRQACQHRRARLDSEPRGQMREPQMAPPPRDLQAGVDRRQCTRRPLQTPGHVQYSLRDAHRASDPVDAFGTTPLVPGRQLAARDLRPRSRRDNSFVFLLRTAPQILPTVRPPAVCGASRRLPLPNRALDLEPSLSLGQMHDPTLSARPSPRLLAKMNV